MRRWTVLLSHDIIWWRLFNEKPVTPEGVPSFAIGSGRDNDIKFPRGSYLSVLWRQLRHLYGVSRQGLLFSTVIEPSSCFKYISGTSIFLTGMRLLIFNIGSIHKKLSLIQFHTNLNYWWNSKRLRRKIHYHYSTS